jgi:hypothetical protein
MVGPLNDTQKKIPQNHTQILYYKNCPSKMGEIIQNLTLGYMSKTLNQIICFFSPPKSEYFFQQHWESEYFFRKKPLIPLHTNFVLQKLSLKDGGNHIYIYIVHSTCNIVTIRFKGREGGLKNPYKISWPTKFVNNVCVTQKRQYNVHWNWQ